MKKILKKTIFLVSLSLSSIIGLSGAYNDPTFDFNYYKRALSFPFSEPIKQYSWYTPKVKIEGTNINLPYAKTGEDNISQEAIKQIVDYAKNNNSLGVMVVHHGKIVAENYFRDWSDQLAGDSESMAKSVLAIMIGIAIDQGKIFSENDPVSLYLPEWRNDERRRIKIKNLLQMTSGLRNSSSTSSPFSDLAKLHLGFDAKNLALSIPAEISPGRKFDYNNVNSQILGILLERVTGKSYAEYVSENLWKPLGASDAEVWVDNTGTARTYCCLFARMKDWAKLGLLVMHNGKWNGKQIVSKEWIEKMITPSRKAANYGLHIWLAKSSAFKRYRLKDNFIDENMIFFDGRSKQRVFIFPDKDMVVVRVGDTSDRWKEDIIPNILVKDLEGK